MLEPEPSSGASSTPPVPARQPQGLFEKIFLNDQELRTIWRVLLYGLFWITFSFGLDLVAIELFGFTGNPISAQRVLREDLLSFLAAFGAALAMAKLERRPVDVYGLPRERAFGKLFWQGCLFGLVEVSLLLGSIAAFGGYSFGPVSLHGLELAWWGGLWFVSFVAVGLSEEYLFRGYPQFTLARGVGFWPAVGWHAAFDFGETFLYSVPDSGMLFEHHLSSASLHGATWLTGGTVGPEGSVFSFLIMGIMAIAIHFLFPANKSALDQK